MFDLGIQELVVIFIVALIVFGPKRLPELGKTLGKGMLELRKAMEGVREQMHAESEALSKPLEGSTAEGQKTEGTGDLPPAASHPEAPHEAGTPSPETDAAASGETPPPVLPETGKDEQGK